MTVSFKFSPMQHVVITAYDLNYAGRVTYCMIGGSGSASYTVEYAQAGSVQSRNFYEDELKELKCQP